MALPLPVEWRCDIDQEAATIRDLLDKQPDVVQEMRDQTTFGNVMANWGLGIAANILNAKSDHARVMRAWAWIETLEDYRR